MPPFCSNAIQFKWARKHTFTVPDSKAKWIEEQLKCESLYICGATTLCSNEMGTAAMCVVH